MNVSMDTRLQNFWKESINKEASVRFAWQLKYSKEFAKQAYKKPPNNNSNKSGMMSLNTNLNEKIRRMEEENKRAHSRLMALMGSAAVGKKGKPLDDLDRLRALMPAQDMRPSSTNTRALLYNGISAHEEGRYAYLKKRNTVSPEKKFEFPILTSCQYGWKILNFTERQRSPFARMSVIRDSFYRNSGIALA